jgi:hypothetical protein
MLKYRVPHGYQHANNSVIGPAVINNSLRVPSTRTVFAGLEENCFGTGAKVRVV